MSRDTKPIEADLNGQPEDASPERRTFLFLQGPVGGFFPRLASGLAAEGHKALRINLNTGDWVFWRVGGATNYKGSLEDWPAFLADFLDRHGVTDILLLGEQRPYHKVAVALAKERNIQVAVTDFGYLRPDWITFEPFGMNAASRLTRDPEELREIAREYSTDRDLSSTRFSSAFWSMALPDLVYNISTQLCWYLFPHYRSHQKYNAAATYVGVMLRLLTVSSRNRHANQQIERLVKNNDKEPVFLLPLQMETDFQLRAYSHFSSMKEVMEQVIESFARGAPQAAKLVVKLHPYDPAVQNFRRKCSRLAHRFGVSDRVIFIDGGNGDALLKGCAGTITVNSTMGLQALNSNCPVFLLSNANYRVRGLVKLDDLDSFWSDPGEVDPELRSAFLTAMTASCLIRGVFYNEPGLTHAIGEAKRRIVARKVGLPMRREELDPRSVL
ncbi:MAG: capsular biosynthesis protein [Pseudomonadota bacterium]